MNKPFKPELDDLQKQTDLVDLIDHEHKYKSSMKLNEAMWAAQDKTQQEVGYLPENYNSFVDKNYQDALQFLGLEMVDGEVRKKK
jgi:hypothetical protein